MILIKLLCALLLAKFSYNFVDCRSYNNGLIFYNLETKNSYLPPTISVSRGRVLANYKYSPLGSIWSTFGRPCDCVGPVCGCCVGIKVKQYNFDQKMCANVSYYLPKDEIQLEVFFNDTATAKYGIAARNPSPLCVPVMMVIPMSMCIQMSNIGIQGDNLNMCMDFLVRLASTELFEMHFQCMKVGLQGASWVGPDGQPVIPANEGKIQVKVPDETDDYYDESGSAEENEILSKENDEETAMTNTQPKEDDNDITEKLKDIVKEQETETDQENKPQDLWQNDVEVEEIVTNIMDSINEGNAAEEVRLEGTLTEMDANKTKIEGSVEQNASEGTESCEENMVSVEADEIKEDIEQINKTESETEVPANIENEHESNMEQNNNTKIEEIEKDQEIQIEDEINKSKIEMEDRTSVVENTETPNDFSNVGMKNELLSEEFYENPYDEDTKMLNNTDKIAVTNEVSTSEYHEFENSKKPIVVLEESATEELDNKQGSTANEKFGSFNYTADKSQTDGSFNDSLEIAQQIIETNTEHLLVALLTPTIPQDVTSEIGIINTTNNTLTTAAAITTSTNNPTKSDANLDVAQAFIENKDGVDKNNSDDDQDEDEDNKNSDGGGDCDNSHENDSDYEDEESEETEDEIKETEIKLNNNTNSTKYNNDSLSDEELANDSFSNESQSSEGTNDEFEAVEWESAQHDTDTEEKHSENYEDYATTTATSVTISDTRIYNDNDTCCKPAMSFSNTTQMFDDKNNNLKIPQMDTASSNNLKIVNNNNSLISHVDDDNLLNVKSTTNKMSQLMVGSAATVNTATSINATSSNRLPLPLGRKLYSLHRQQQLHYHHSRQRQQRYV